MADIRPASQLLNQMFSEEQRTEYAALRTYFEEGKSIFPLVEQGVQGLVRNFSLSPQDARQFLRRANSMAIYVRRQFIEHSLRSDKAVAAAPSSGFLSMVEGPSFESLFSPDFDSACPPQALESLASPVAYLIELMRWIEQRIESAPPDGLRLPLHDRRTDLKPMSVDFNAVHQPVSSVDIIVSVLEKFITNHAPSVELEQAMIVARYPNGLPYYQHWVTLDGVARHHHLSVGNFAHMVDLSYPYFLREQAWDADAGRALSHASRLGPYQRQLLTEDAVEQGNSADFYLNNFGADEKTSKDLNLVPCFGERTKLDTLGLEALLSVRSFAPVLSANVTYLVSGGQERSGSVYLNANSSPAVIIETSAVGEALVNKLSANPADAAGLARYDRMNRKLRLDQWLELPSEQVDALLVAAMKAESRADTINPWVITDPVVHALGLFQLLRENYGCTAADFAVFLDELSLYGRGEALSQFDQVFNDRGKYREPFKLDSGEFPVLPEPGSSDLTVSQLCSALAIDLKTYQYLALAIAAAHGIEDGNLLRNAAIISSFYRLVKLPRLLGITPVEGVLMLTLLGGETWANGLAGVPVIHHVRLNTPDVLNLIYALHSCVGWCKDRKIAVLWMLQQVAPPQTLPASDIDKRLFEQVLNLLPAALFTNSALLAEGVPELPGQSWLDFLMSLVDRDGLIASHAGTEAEFLIHAREQLEKAVTDGLGDEYELERPALVEKMLGVLLRARDAQVSVVKECLAAYAGVDAEQALQVLMWAEGTVQQFLRQVLERAVSGGDDSVRGRKEEPDPLLALLADVRRRSAVVAKLELSAVLLQDYLLYGHKAWLDQDPYAFTMHTLYYLTSLTRAFELSEQPAQKLLDYLREVNALPPVLSPDALELARQAAANRLAEFFDWSVQEVSECVNRIDPDGQILKNLTQLDLLLRVRVLARHTGMDALTIFLVGMLPEEVNMPKYQDAAERALLSLSESTAPLVAFAEDLKQLVSLTSVADSTEVISKPGEKIIFTVTVKGRDGEPLSGVYVYWHATLGTIARQATGTDGTLKAEFIPGKVLGFDTPMFWLDLFEPQYAQTIEVVADADTLQFPPPYMSPVPSRIVGYGEEIRLEATLMDGHQNLGTDSLVDWLDEVVVPTGSKLTIRPRQGLTNEKGEISAFLSSPTGGTFRVSVLTQPGDRTGQFEDITFAGPPGELP